jgi:glycosyltransferase involved in cell wall biosynthesis
MATISDGQRTKWDGRCKVLLVHQFLRPRVSGVTVLIDALLRLVASGDPGFEIACLGYEGCGDPSELVSRLDAHHADTTCVVGMNLHIEVGWTLTEALARWCRVRGTPFYVHVHDYWPHHRSHVQALRERFEARFLAITPAIRDALATDGFPSELLPVGVTVPPAAPAVIHPWPRSRRRTIATVGRLVPRKRFDDVAAAFRLAALGPDAELYMLLPPSLVYPTGRDLEVLAGIQSRLENRADRDMVRMELQPRHGVDYRHWFLYVLASEYEGLSLTPIEALLQGCPPILSDIRPHRAIVDALFPDMRAEFLFPVGDPPALAELLRDEFVTGRRRAALADRRSIVHDVAVRTWSLRSTAHALADLAQRVDPSASPGTREPSGRIGAPAAVRP